jgi:alpha-glucosidase
LTSDYCTVYFNVVLVLICCHRIESIRMGIKDKYLWWERGIIYQIYPRSFMDSNGDGVGDLRGIISKLDYLVWLGIDAIWLSPIYPSPMADFGYDITDYTNIDPQFGTIDDFDALLEAAHEQEIMVILDFVPNHTSDKHPWFIESSSSRENSKRDWYIWHDPAPDGGPPNNWLSNFGGSAWEWDETTGQYYYHAYLKQQPDLNWRNREVLSTMLDILRFWLDRGVDGFRVDVIWHLIKDEQFRDNPPNPEYRPDQSPYFELLATYSSDRPEVHDIIAGMRRVLNEYDDKMMIGEIYLPVERLITYYGVSGSGAHLPFNFQLIQLDWNASKIAEAINKYEAALPDYGWPNWVLGNHDRSRIASRIGKEQARVAAMMLLTLRGTPTIYYGDEIGMSDVPIPPEMVQDPWEKNVPGLGLGRDPVRTPMQWDNSPNAGFSKAEPWLPISDQYIDLNVSNEREDPKSILNLYHRLIELRRNEPALMVGSYNPVTAGENLLCYLRQDGERRLLIALNLSHQSHTLTLENLLDKGRLMFSTYLDRGGEELAGSVDLRADEGIIVELS